MGSCSHTFYLYIHYKPQNTLLWLLQRANYILNKLKSEDKSILFWPTYVTFLVLLIPSYRIRSPFGIILLRLTQHPSAFGIAQFCGQQILLTFFFLLEMSLFWGIFWLDSSRWTVFVYHFKDVIHWFLFCIIAKKPAIILLSLFLSTDRQKSVNWRVTT